MSVEDFIASAYAVPTLHKLDREELMAAASAAIESDKELMVKVKTEDYQALLQSKSIPEDTRYLFHSPT